MQEFSINALWESLPQPVLSILKIKIDKDFINSISFGDYLYYRAGGLETPGGYRTGQFASTGMLSFGWWYLPLLGIGIIPLFFLLDLFVIAFFDLKQQKYYTHLSLAGLISITSYFMFLSLSNYSESVVNIYTYIIRGWIQMAFLYWIVYLISRKIASAINL